MRSPHIYCFFSFFWRDEAQGRTQGWLPSKNRAFCMEENIWINLLGFQREMSASTEDTLTTNSAWDFQRKSILDIACGLEENDFGSGV